jgi:hypothetical protein
MPSASPARPSSAPSPSDAAPRQSVVSAVIYDCSGKPDPHPSDAVLTCADAGWTLGHLTWTGWGPDGVRERRMVREELQAELRSGRDFRVPGHRDGGRSAWHRLHSHERWRSHLAHSQVHVRTRQRRPRVPPGTVTLRLRQVSSMQFGRQVGTCSPWQVCARYSMLKFIRRIRAPLSTVVTPTPRVRAAAAESFTAWASPGSAFISRPGSWLRSQTETPAGSAPERCPAGAVDPTGLPGARLQRPHGLPRALVVRSVDAIGAPPPVRRSDDAGAAR